MKGQLLSVTPEMFPGRRPPACPEIRIDSSLGIAPEEMDFDFQEFYELGRDSGQSKEEITDYGQDYLKASRKGLLGFHKDNRSLIYVQDCINFSQWEPAKVAKRRERIGAPVFNDMTPAGVIREVAIHELGHYVDCTNGNFGHNRMRRRMRIIGSAALITSAPVEQLYNPAPSSTAIAVSLLLAPIIANIAVDRRQRSRTIMAGTPLEAPAYAFQAANGHRPIVNFPPLPKKIV